MANSNSNSTTNFLVKDIYIDFDSKGTLELKVLFDNWIQSHIDVVFGYEYHYKNFILKAFMDNNDNDCLKNVDDDGIDPIQVKHAIKEHKWKVKEFYLNIFKTGRTKIGTVPLYDYLVNNILGIRRGEIFGKHNGYGVSITIPTTNYELLNDMITFRAGIPIYGYELYGIADLISEIKERYKKIEKESVAFPIVYDKNGCHKIIYPQYELISSDTHFIVEEHDKFTCIAYYLREDKVQKL